ncbi:tetratricopeptide repeat protein, partial [Bacteroidota bacterium]
MKRSKILYIILLSILICNNSYTNYFQNANLLYKNNQFTEAINEYKKSISYYSSFKKNDSLIQVYVNISHCYLSNNKTDSSIYYLKKADQVYNSNNINDIYINAKIENNWGDIYKRKNFNTALSKYKKVLSDLISIKDTLELIKQYKKLGILYFHYSDYNHAIEYFLHAVSFGNIYDSIYSELFLYYYLGENYFFAGDNDLALIYYNICDSLSDIYRRSNPAIKSKILNRKARVLRSQYKYLDAIKISKVAEILITENFGPLSEKLIPIYRNTGMLYYHLYEYEKALNYLNQAILINNLSNYEDSTFISYIYSSIGLVYNFYETDYYKAIDYFKKAIEIRKKEKNLLLGPLYEFCGMDYFHIGDYKNAEKHFMLSIKDFDEKLGTNNNRKGNVLLLLGNLKLKTGEYDTGIKLLDEAYRLLMDRFKNNTYKAYRYYEYLGDHYYEIKNYHLAVMNYNDAINALLRGEDSSTYFKSPISDSYKGIVDIELFLHKKGKALYNQYKVINDTQYLFSALDHYLKAIKAIEYKQRYCSNLQDRVTFSKTMTNIFYEALEVSIDAYKINTNPKFENLVFYFTEKCRATALQSFLIESNAMMTSGISDELIEKENEINLSLNNIKSQIEAIKNDSSKAQELTNLKQKLFIKEKEKDELIDYFEKKYPNYYD